MSTTTTRNDWQRAARLEDLNGDGPHALSAGGVPLVAVQSRAGLLKVFEGRCPHQGALLGEGEIEGTNLVCRNHRWKFDRDSGQRVGGRQCLVECPSEARGTELFVDVAPIAAQAEAKQGGATQQATRTIADLPGPKGLPIVGSSLAIDFTRFHLQLEEWAREFGPTYVVKLGPRTVIVSANPEHAETIFRERPEKYRRVSTVESVFSEMGALGVFGAEGNDWRAQRPLAMQALAHKHLRSFYPTLQLVATRLIERWKRAADAGRVLDITDELKRFTVDVTTSLVFGHDINTIEKGDSEDIIQRHLEEIFPAFNRRLNALVPYWRWVKLPQDRRLDRALTELRTWIDSLVARAREKLAADPKRAEAPENFIEAMLVARDAEGQPFSDTAIYGNALTMLLAGEDTTAYTLAWCVHHLCDEREATKELRAELDGVLGSEPLPRDLEQAGRLPYAMAVANEAMRLRSVAPMVFHEPLEDVVLDGIAIPKATVLINLTRAPVVDEKNFRDPERFIPERWLASWKGAHEPSTHVPFGSGPRICPGRSLALLEMRVVLAALYRNFEVERVGPAKDVREVTSFTMMPHGITVLLRQRRPEVVNSKNGLEKGLDEVLGR